MPASFTGRQAQPKDLHIRIFQEGLEMNNLIKDPDILGGEPVFRGTRVPFQNLLDYFENGKTLNHFLEEFPTVTREQAIAAIEEAKKIVFASL
jgi:uncharacterized protein (DUF433 family)